MTPLEKWLADATRGLSPESAAQVREEIQQHYDSASEAGDDAIAALGDPRAANRGYRKALLTETEAILAPALTRTQRPSVERVLLVSAALAAVVWLLSRGHHGPGFWPITVAIYCAIPMGWFLPLDSLRRTRARAILGAIQVVAISGLAWWYQGWAAALFLAPFTFLLLYYIPHQPRMSIFQKLNAGQTYSPLAGEPELTHLEAIFLYRLEHPERYEHLATAFVLLIMAGMTVWQPATFVPMTICLIAGFVAQRTLPIYTEERSRLFRTAKWTAMAVAAALPVLYGARIPLAGAIWMLFLFWLFDLKAISVRRKLPVAEWPKRLYW